MSVSKQQAHVPQTTGHVWDGDLQEYNNPLPNWWLIAFYTTVVFALVYWFIYPAWPIGGSYTKGFATITYTNDKGETKTVPWNTRALLMAETNKAEAMQKPYFDKIASTPFEQIAKDPELNSFVLSAGKTLFSDNCAPCHQQGGAGKVGFAPNLTDDDWLYGGHFAQIQQTITNGRHGYMPPFATVLDDKQMTELADYILSFEKIPVDPASAKAGDELFHSETAACYYCHGANAKGRQVIGSANLTDSIWLWANVPDAKTVADKEDAIKTVIRGGLNKGVMPTWKERLSPDQIKLLAVYVHDLGGGQ
ncbi:MAG: cytochrome-c oxidase, cbb3-type subunit III [Betaproteobacteria bacterium]|nr:cytochrome-c oxidase, cbb3-type subunit III [Betaproteobacteria bacterium]